MARLILRCTILSLVLACAERVAPAPLPSDAVPFGPPAVYAKWWREVEECSGLAAPVARIRWFAVPGAQSFLADGQKDYGVWIEHYRYIVLAEQHLDDSLVVRHEMLHDLLNRVDHPAGYFRERCGGLVFQP